MLLKISRRNAEGAVVVDEIIARPSVVDPRADNAVLQQFSLRIDAQDKTEEGDPSGGYEYSVLLDDISSISVERRDN